MNSKDRLALSPAVGKSLPPAHRLTLALMMAIGCIGSAAQASPITYTISGTVDARLMGTATTFTQQLLTITTVADTDLIASGTSNFGVPVPYYFNQGTTTFTIGSVSGTFTGALGASSVVPGAISYDQSSYGLVRPSNYIVGLGYSNSPYYGAVLAMYAPTFYNLASNVNYTGVGPMFSAADPVITTAGTLLIDENYGNGKFTATIAAAPVPEIDPATGASALSLVAGVLGVIEQRRRRCMKAALAG